MKIAIIGGGITGLTAAYTLAKKGHQITIFEKEKTLGGLAHGFKRPGWDWRLEAAYHHLFTNDTAILGLIKELGLESKLIIKRPTTANFVASAVIPGLTRDPSFLTLDPRLRGDDNILLFDSPIHLLTYPGLSFLDKLRTGVLMVLMKLNPFWQPLEWISAKKLFVAIAGLTAWRILWEPLMIGKFGKYAESIAASWLWARIKKRTQKLCYIQGGFHTLVNALETSITSHGGALITNTSVLHIKKRNSQFSILNSQFDRVLLTVPTPIAAKLIPHSSFIIPHSAFLVPHLHAQTLILETKEPILPDVYWLNITDRSFPFLSVVAHTNFMDPSHYGGHHITYFGNYLPDRHRYLSMSAEQLLEEFLPFIHRLSSTSKFKIQTSNSSKKSFKFKVLSLHSFVGPFAQPVHELHYSRRAPKLTTSIPGLYLANMDSIYPWDRGTNYAVELGIRAAKFILSSQR